MSTIQGTTEFGPATAAKTAGLQSSRSDYWKVRFRECAQTREGCELSLVSPEGQ